VRICLVPAIAAQSMTSDRLAPCNPEGFQTALEKARLRADEEPASNALRPHTFNHVPDLWAQRPYVPLALARSYEDGDPNLAADAAIENATIVSVARELGLDTAKSMADLLQLRRAFALRNHPDLVPQEKRARATARMALANFLIDREIRARTLVTKQFENSGDPGS
jgi:hypothetical protein